MKRYELTDVSTRDYYPRHEMTESLDGDFVKYADVLIAIAAIDMALRVPAAEYVPAIGDAFALIDKHFGDAISPHHRTIPQQERAWICERSDHCNGTPAWLCACGGCFSWTTDSLKAIRFSRREDAEQIATIVEGVDSITEH